MVIRRVQIRLAAATLAAMCAIAPIGQPQANAADLGSRYGTRAYISPSPCALYEASFRETLASMRATARALRAQERHFIRLKRRRNNDGFAGSDISLNAVMSAEQIDIATKASQVATTIAQARRLECRARGRLNAADNEAFRLDREIAQEAIWVDPRTFW